MFQLLEKMEKGSNALNARLQTVLLAVCLFMITGLLVVCCGLFLVCFFHFVTKSYWTFMILLQC